MKYLNKNYMVAVVLLILTTPLYSKIFFGDFHVHTTNSADAFISNLPILNGDGIHSVEQACDFAQYCSEIDFFALTDHAESNTAKNWKNSLDSLSKCNGKISQHNNKKLTVFAGFEWTNVGDNAQNHYGHQNVIFKSLDQEKLPLSAISSEEVKSGVQAWRPSTKLILKTIFSDFFNLPIYLKFIFYQKKLKERISCLFEGNNEKECIKIAKTPLLLIEELKKTKSEFTVIPHGMSWGYYTPMGFDFNDQIISGQFNQKYQFLTEVYSGHGTSEVYRNFKSIDYKPISGEMFCPDSTKNFEPCCKRAGIIIQEECVDPLSKLCISKIKKAELDYLSMGVAGHLSIPWAGSKDWKDCGVCRDCYSGALHYRPKGSAQHIIASGNNNKFNKFKFKRLGFIGSSDNHSARPGNGYKEKNRLFFTDTYGPRTKDLKKLIKGKKKAANKESNRTPRGKLKKMSPFKILDINRQTSMYTTGGLIAVHAEKNDRNSIWKAMKNRNVYATSGEKIKLNFQLKYQGSVFPMGSELSINTNPQFHIWAKGSEIQIPGCPTNHPLSKTKQKKLCGGECFNPSGKFKKIKQFEVIKITPRLYKNEYIGDLIQDPWKILKCNQLECEYTFRDDNFLTHNRPSIYYIRVIQEKSQIINGNGIMCKDEMCTEVALCTGGFDTDDNSDCLGPASQRAWSSPIYLYKDPY